MSAPRLDLAHRPICGDTAGRGGVMVNVRPFHPPSELPSTADVIENARMACKVATHFRKQPDNSSAGFVIEQLHDALYAAMHKMALLHLMLGAHGPATSGEGEEKAK